MPDLARKSAAVLLLCATCAGPHAEEHAAPSGATQTPPKETMKQRAMNYPQTREQDQKDTIFGTQVSDPYRWLEDDKSAEVKTWMGAQDKTARDYLAALPGREALQSRLRALYYVESLFPPRHRGKRYFYARTHADKEKAILYWKEGDRGAEKVLLDPNQMSEDGSISLGVTVPTHDGKTLAYGLRRNNADEATLYVLNVASGKVSDTDVIEGAKYAVPSWTPAGDGFYYTYLPGGSQIPVAERPGHAEIRFHRLGTDPRKDPLIHEKTGDPQTFLQSDLSRDGHWLFLQIQHGWNRNDVYFRDLRGKDKTFRPLAVGIDALFQVSAWKDQFYIFTNDGAPRGRMFRTDGRKPERTNWQEIVPEDPEAVIENVDILGGHLALTYLRNAANELELRGLDGTKVRRIALPGIGTAGLLGTEEDDEAYYTFTSFTTPREIYRTSIKTGETALWDRVKLPIDPTPFAVEQVFYPSRDGTKISMFLVHRKDMARDGMTPFLLTGYGGFNVSRLPEFSARLYPWLEAGGGYALPNLRGGGEYGEKWHRAGMMEHKQNVFDDFIAAAEYLIKQGDTRPDRLTIRGGSNGGLLMGAAVAQRPDLFRAVVCEVPLLDMVRYHLFGSGKTWIPEYGSAEDEAQFKVLLGYSPYHHVKEGTAYPSVLMMSADSDDRVDPMHARKMTALLQKQSGSGHPVLLRIEKNAGHGGADLIRQAVEQGTDAYAFLMHEIGMTPGPAPQAAK